MIRLVVFGLLLLGLGAPVRAAPEDAYQAASRLAGDPATVPRALAAFEELGAVRPSSRWTDNAWSEAGRLAERLGERTRARTAYQQVLALTDDPVLRERARRALARLGAAAWDEVRREHAHWLAESLRGDPGEALAALEELARAHRDYPERANLWLAIARGWELEGERARALALLREPLATATAADRDRLGFAFARIAIRGGFLDEARGVLDQLASADRGVVAKLRDRLDTAARRRWTRRGMALALVVLGALALGMLRREAGSWRAVGRRLARPPAEVIFLLPVAGVLVAVASTGNPLVARALLAILAAGVVATWLSGALFELHRRRLGAARLAIQLALVLAAVGCATYLAIDRDRLLDLVEETVEHGPATP